MKKSIHLGCVMLGIAFSAAPAVWADNAQLRVDQINADSFPQMTLYSTVADQTQNPVTDLKDEAWEISADGVTLRVSKKITPFQFSQERIALVVILAASGIMKGRPLESEKEAVAAIASKLQPNDKLAVLIYGDRVENLVGFSVKPEDRRVKLKKIATVGDAVMLYDALWQGLELLSPKNPLDLPVRKGIIVVSDGRDGGSTSTRAEVMDRIKHSNIPVYGVGFTLLSEKYLPALKAISEASGGAYWNAPLDSSIAKCFEKILGQIQNGYLISFKAKGVPGDGQVHQLTLKADVKGKTLAATKGFLAKGRPKTLWEIITQIVLVVLLAALVVAGVWWYFFYPIRGFKRKCPACKRIMKDEWEECMFCKYVPLYSKEVLKTKR